MFVRHNYRNWGLSACLLLGMGGVGSAARADETAAPPPGPEVSVPIHFLVDMNISNDYYTPRGLVVVNNGASIHLLALAIADLYKNSGATVLNGVTVTGGVWNNFQTDVPSSTNTDWAHYNEVDPILAIDFTLFKNLTLGVTYVPFIDPSYTGFKQTEENVEFKIAYDDTDLLGPFAVHPYVKPFWHFSGPSPVVLGDHDAWDFELGINPGVKLLQDSSVPVSLNFPIFCTLGDSSWFGDSSSAVGHVAAGVTVTVPLDAVMGTEHGLWSVYAGFEYSHIFNDSLLMAGTIVSGNTSRDVYVGTMGVKVFIP